MSTNSEIEQIRGELSNEQEEALKEGNRGYAEELEMEMVNLSIRLDALELGID